MDELDRALARLAGTPAPAELDGIEAQVFARIGSRPVVRQTGIGLGVVTAAALAIGIVGAELPAAARPTVPLAPLGGASPLAPSSLLLGEQ
ncbi:hypothetical protein [Sphingomonas abaci]|uniref:Anti-sigma factor n=1 Tax=Sphingomonas abaci TaxID=237611 RepID=A0A7W7AP71_9SPHN|nr:hypothetical protein [Sphingomonas abaci]MBB4619755.1 hypothetical protein [Sphingomonas abaci]